MYIANNRIRMYDTDMAGILYFGSQFRLVHDALEEFFEKEGFSFSHIFQTSPYAFVVVHAESDYYKPFRIGDGVEVHLAIESIRNTSFTVVYQIYRADKTHMGKAKTVHVTIDRLTWEKRPIPEEVRTVLNRHLPL